MLSQSQYLTPDRGRQGLSGLRDGLGGGGLSPRGPQELFGLGGARSPQGQGSGQQGEEALYRGENVVGGGGYSSPQPAASYMTGEQSGGGYSTTPQATTWSTRADYAMNAPTVWQKCAELGPVLTTCPVKELHSIWRTVVERIFCLGGGRGWGVSTTLRSQHPREYQAIATFLSSTGPLLSACHRLLADPYIRYEFPVSRLSSSIISRVNTGALSSFLATRLAPGLQQLSLNSFEYYMFTFSVYIVQPYTLDNRLVAGESLYPYILEDYLSYYLPCDGTTPPPLPFQLSLPSSPGQGLSPKHQQQDQASTTLSTPARKSLLRHPSMLSPTPSTPRPSPMIPAPASLLPSGDQTWRSETILSIFSCVWLTQFSSSFSGSPTSATSSELPIPVSDTLKIVRMLIKHLHYFSNSGGPSDITPLDQLKRATLPGVKQQMYSLFKYIFGHWPHDTSFRLVLETWLSFIQPWRYTDRGRPVADSDPAPVDGRWQGWVAENILLYSEVIRLLLPRFFRMDLTASKNAYMLFRWVG
jgi:sphingomyelin phosphodiesterase 4